MIAIIRAVGGEEPMPGVSGQGRIGSTSPDDDRIFCGWDGRGRTGFVNPLALFLQWARALDLRAVNAARGDVGAGDQRQQLGKAHGLLTQQIHELQRLQRGRGKIADGCCKDVIKIDDPRCKKPCFICAAD